MNVRIKGQGFVGFMATLQRLHGADAHEKVLAGLPPEVAAALRNGEIVPMGWYPVEWYSALHTAARAVCGPGVSREVGRAAAQSDARTIYRFILKFFSPETLLGQSAKVFALFCEGGSCKVEMARKGSARIRYGDCPGASRGMWEVICGGTDVLVELCGGREVTVKPVGGGGDGDSVMIVQVSWVDG